jgi:tetratricopeptide (TPR) repeat protein
MSTMFRQTILILTLGVGAIAVSGQDLGSSNRLFGGAPARSAKKAPVRPAAKETRTSPKASSTAGKKATPTKTKTAPPKREPGNDTTAEKPRTGAPTKKAIAKGERARIVTEEPGAARKTVGKKEPAKTGTERSASAAGTAKPKVETSKGDAAKTGTSSRTLNQAAKGQDQSATDAAADGKRFSEFKSFNNQGAKEPVVREPAGVSPFVSDRDYDDLIEDGNVGRDERNYTAAEKAYTRAKSLRPKDSRAAYGLGNLYSDQQRWEEAEKAYRVALQIDPNSSFAHIALSYVLSQPVAASNLSERYEEAEKLARKAIQLSPSNSLAHDQLGVALELRGLIGPETENAYRRAIQLDPNFAPAHAHLGRLLRRRGMKTESSAAYEKAFAKANDVATKILVAEVMQSEQKFTESVDVLREALAEDPRNPAGLLLLARALSAGNQFPEAETILLRAINVSPNGFVPNSLLATVYFRQGKLEAAENALLQALRFVSVNDKRLLSQQFENLGDQYAKTGRTRNAERVYRQAKTLFPETETVNSKLSRIQRG